VRHTSRGIDRGAVHRRSWPQRICLLLVLFFFSGIDAHPAWSQASEQQKISVKAQDQPLNDVLADIARKTGYRISINDQWKEHRVAVAFRDKPLDKALKYILADFNHAIFFGPDNQIRIVIYSFKEHGESDTAPTPIYRPEPPTEEPERVEEEPTEPQEPVAVERDEPAPEESAGREETVEEQAPAEPSDSDKNSQEVSEPADPDRTGGDQAPEAPRDQEQTN